jgi:iron complex transport system permease protein
MRNVLASPDVLGVSSGASLGVMLGVYMGVGVGAAGAAWQGIPALAGAIGALLAVLALSRRAGIVDPSALIIVGVVVSVLCGAGVVFVQHLMPDVGYSSVRLLMGGLSDETSTLTLAVCAACTLTCTALAAKLGPTLDAAALSPDEAMSLGVRLGHLRLIALLLTGLLTAAAVVLAGPVGFIGLIAPHAARALLGIGASRHRAVVIGASLLGAAIVALADALIRLIDLGAGRMPLGVLTALVGGPTLVLLLRRHAWTSTT